MIGESWDVVDQASYESFPASDPPGWGSFRAAPSAETCVVAVAPKQRTTRPGDRRLGLAIVLGSIVVWLLARARRRTRADR